MRETDAYDELGRCYNLLGVSPGASSQELKTAHRDMAKVWHPDRFAHDPRLQQKAQEKLKEINEAYDRLTSGKWVRRAAGRSSANRADVSRPAAGERRFRWQLILLPILVSGVVFFAAFRALVPSGKLSAQAPLEQEAGQTRTITDEEQPHPDAGSARGRKRDDARPAGEVKPVSSTTIEQDAPQGERRPLPTVTLMIDPMTGLLATPSCPTKSRMTYPSGSEPTQSCNASHQAVETTTQEAQSRPRGSRFKSFARRLASPAKLIRGVGGSGDERPDR
jgi:hypothetical protein